LRASGLVVAALATASMVSPVVRAENGTLDVAPSYVFMATVTGYANGADGGAVGTTTATGTRTRWGTVAADWRLFPPGTRLQIEGFGDDVFVVEDTGSGVRGQLIDVWFPDVETAQAFGTQKRLVAILPP
jgi:3D (Asp-Asp-Asp) domain-containing protein